MNQIPSGMFPLSRKSFPPDIKQVQESYEVHDSGNDEDPRKAAKKTGGKALIPEQYPPLPIRFYANYQQYVRRAKSQLGKGAAQALYIGDSEEESMPPMQSEPPSMNSKRPCNRSRSITPPPELAPEQERKARNLVR